MYNGQMINPPGYAKIYGYMMKKEYLYMKISITASAADKIDEKRKGKQGYLKLKYDAEECGCIMCGVINLWLVNELEEDDYKMETNHGSIYMEKSKEVFFDESMTIDFNESAYCFQLKSPNQYLNPRMSFMDKTNKNAESHAI